MLMRRIASAAVLVLVTLSLFVAIPSAWAAAGDLDPAFGSGGIVTTPVGSGTDKAVAIAIQPSDGKIVVGGYTAGATGDDWAIARYNTNGTLDSSFDGDGVVTTSFGSGTDHAHAVAIDVSGNIVVAGYAFNGTDTDFAVARYDTNGALDTTFSGAGKDTTAMGAGDDEINGLAIDANGKIVVAGQSVSGTSNLFALARYDANGTLDPGFSGDGKATTNVDVGSDAANAVAIQSDGKIVAAGRANNGVDREFALVRYGTNGTLDGTFGAGGVKETSVGPGDDEINAVAIQSDGKIVVAGDSDSGVNTDFALARYGTGGALDSSFGGTGKVTTNIGHNDAAYGVAIDTNGDIVAGGTAASFYFAVARYGPDGTPDTGFGGTGVVYTAVSSFGSNGSALAIQPADANIVLAGDAYGSDDDFAVVRYLVGPPVPNYQPDEAIKAPRRPYAGDNAYNTTALSQTVTVKAKRGTSKSFSIRVENDGSVSDSFSLAGPGGQTGFTAKYLQGANDVTSQIVAGTFMTSSLVPGASVVVKLVVTVKRTAGIGVVKAWVVTATSTTSTSKQDVVKAKVKATA